MSKDEEEREAYSNLFNFIKKSEEGGIGRIATEDMNDVEQAMVFYLAVCCTQSIDGGGADGYKAFIRRMLNAMEGAYGREPVLSLLKEETAHREKSKIS